MIQIPWQLIPMLIIGICWLAYYTFMIFDEDAEIVAKPVVVGITFLGFAFYLVYSLIVGLSKLTQIL